MSNGYGLVLCPRKSEEVQRRDEIFATQQEAEAYGKHVLQRLHLSHYDVTAFASAETPTHSFTDGRLEELPSSIPGGP